MVISGSFISVWIILFFSSFSFYWNLDDLDFVVDVINKKVGYIPSISLIFIDTLYKITYKNIQLGTEYEEKGR